MTLLGSSKLAEKQGISEPFIKNSVKTFEANPNQLVENMNRQNGITNGKIIKFMRPKTDQSGGAFWLKHAEAISQSKSPLGVQLSTPKVTPKNTQNVVVPQFPDNNTTPTSSTEIAKGIIKNQYEMHVQSSTDGGTTVQSLGNEQQSGGRRKKRKTSIRKKKSRVRKSRKKRMTRSRKRIRHTR